MLLAEIHGHRVPEAEGSEDFLTSAVFGHLRYLRPNVFWEKFLSKAAGMPVGGTQKSLAGFLAGRAGGVSRYSQVRARFWPSHPSLGTPDLVLCFTGPELPALVLVVEAKLAAGKSGSGKDDQLYRYLRILEDLEPLDLGLSGRVLAGAVTAVLFLTPRESLPELMESAALCEPGLRAGERLFRAQWQDIVVAARECMCEAGETERMILGDVSAFLRARGLEHFGGFARMPVEPLERPAGTYYSGGHVFAGFTTLPLPRAMAGSGSPWTR